MKIWGNGVLCWAIFCSFSTNAADNSTLNRVVEVQWPSDYTGAAAPLPDGRLSEVNNVHLPVLIPNDFFKYEDFQLVAQELSYTASATAQDAKLSISGTRVVTTIPLPNGDDSLSAMNDAVSVTYSENIVQATQQVYGVAYLATIECKIITDARCNESKHVKSILEQAKFIGGNKAQPTPLETTAAAPLPPKKPFDPDNFKYMPPGDLTPGSGKGVTSKTIFAPNIRFPVESPPAFINSQLWGIGGMYGPKGSWKDRANYQYPWRDNFCESRSRDTPSCPSGRGHQGVDIRPASGMDAKYWAVAVEDGKITNVGIYSVTLQSIGSQYRYLHMKMSKLAVKQGDSVKYGQRLGLISNDFDGNPTPVHLHFEILQSKGKGIFHIPPYTSLVEAYQLGN